MPGPITTLSCACGQFAMTLTGEPIISAACHCKSCAEGSKRLEALPTSAPMRSTDGSTPYVLYRKDRVQFPNGTALLAQFYLTPQSPTRRVVTTCCQTPVFVEFKNGHWLSLYASLWRGHAVPPLEIRTMTSDQPEGVAVPDDVPSGRMTTLGFYGRLLAAWAAMGFKTPAINIEKRVEA